MPVFMSILETICQEESHISLRVRLDIDLYTS
jgi:hypothetical protein